MYYLDWLTNGYRGQRDSPACLHELTVILLLMKRKSANVVCLSFAHVGTRCCWSVENGGENGNRLSQKTLMVFVAGCNTPLDSVVCISHNFLYYTVHLISISLHLHSEFCTTECTSKANFRTRKANYYAHAYTYTCTSCNTCTYIQCSEHLYVNNVLTTGRMLSKPDGTTLASH